MNNFSDFYKMGVEVTMTKLEKIHIEKDFSKYRLAKDFRILQ